MSEKQPNMYRYDEFDARFVAERTEQFAAQVARRLSGELTEDQFKPLRLMNGLYLQLHAYMLRVAVPYGTLSSRQMRMLAHIARKYDKGYGHFTTRQNIQYNWPKLVDVPAHPGRPGVGGDACHPDQRQLHQECHRRSFRRRGRRRRSRIPRPLAEIVRQWSSLHPEFVFLPRKFKIAVSAVQPARPRRAGLSRHGGGDRAQRRRAAPAIKCWSAAAWAARLTLPR